MRDNNYFKLTQQEIAEVESLFNRLTLKEKIAQLIMPYVFGNFVSSDSPEYKKLKKNVTEDKVGGFCFFKGTVYGYAHLIDNLQSLSDVPLLITADFERGIAMRLIDGTEFPYNMAVAATGNADYAYQMAKAIAEEMKAIGAHQNFSPVADINSDPENPIVNIRAYSDDKEIVARFCEAFIKGSIDAGALSCAKHFPGHGNTNVDSHNQLPLISTPLNLMNERELYPFIKCIEAGVHAVMIGHLEVPSLEKEKGLPSTLSYSIITQLLKEKLGFYGLIITDAMNMYGVANYFSAADAAVRSINAGADILLFPPDDDIALDSIWEAVSNGTIPEERINESCFKILSAKQSLKLAEKKRINFNNIPEIVGSNRITSIAQEIADKSITLVKDDKNLVPVNRFNKVSCLTITDNVETDTELFFQNHLIENFTLFRKKILNSKSSNTDYEKAFEIAKQSDCVVLPVFVRIRAYQGRFSLLPEQAEFLNKLIKENIDTIIISFGDPYLITSFKPIGTYINAYGDMKISQRAVVKGLLGKIKFEGVSPIKLFL